MRKIRSYLLMGVAGLSIALVGCSGVQQGSGSASPGAPEQPSTTTSASSPTSPQADTAPSGERCPAGLIDKLREENDKLAGLNGAETLEEISPDVLLETQLPAGAKSTSICAFQITRNGDIKLRKGFIGGDAKTVDSLAKELESHGFAEQQRSAGAVAVSNQSGRRILVATVPSDLGDASIDGQALPFFGGLLVEVNSNIGQPF